VIGQSELAVVSWVGTIALAIVGMSTESVILVYNHNKHYRCC